MNRDEFYDSLAHSAKGTSWTKKNHKYVSKTKKLENWVYSYAPKASKLSRKATSTGRRILDDEHSADKYENSRSKAQGGGYKTAAEILRQEKSAFESNRDDMIRQQSSAINKLNKTPVHQLQIKYYYVVNKGKKAVSSIIDSAKSAAESASSKASSALEDIKKKK